MLHANSTGGLSRRPAATGHPSASRSGGALPWRPSPGPGALPTAAPPRTDLFAPVVRKDIGARLARRGAWTLVSSLVQASLVALLALVTARLVAPPDRPVLVPVKLVRPAAPAARPGPPPPPAAALAPRPPPSALPRATVRKPPPGALIQPRELPPQLKAPDPNEPREELEFGDGTDGVVGGVVGGALEAPAALAPAPPPPPPRPVKYDTRMTAPVLVSAPPLEYTQQALEREVEGTMLVECVVEVDGSVRACKVLRSLPFMDRAVISNLEQRRYRPATLGGQPLAVQYTFAVKFKLPE